MITKAQEPPLYVWAAIIVPLVMVLFYAVVIHVPNVVRVRSPLRILRAQELEKPSPKPLQVWMIREYNFTTGAFNNPPTIYVYKFQVGNSATCKAVARFSSGLTYIGDVLCGTD